MTRILNAILPLGPWTRGSGYPFLLDSIRWLRFRDGHICAYEIDSMAYIFESMAAVR